MTTNECSNFFKEINDSMGKYSIKMEELDEFLKGISPIDIEREYDIKYADCIVELL